MEKCTEIYAIRLAQSLNKGFNFKTNTPKTKTR